jgi:hypothetical protein
MRGTPARFVDFRGGVNTKASPYLVDQKEARDARNVVSTTRGSIRKRDGCQTLLTPAVEFMSLAPFEAAATKYLVGVGADTNLYSISSTGTITFLGGPSANAYYDFVQAPANGGQGPLFFVNGNGAGSWDGVAASSTVWTLVSGTLPAPKYLAYHGNRVWMGNLAGGAGLFTGLSDPGSAVCFTDIGNPRSMPVSNVVMFDPNDGDKITGFGKVGPYLLVFKSRKTFVIYDSDTGANRRISDNVGCVASRSVAESPHGTYFLTADRGVYRTNGNSVELVSDSIAPTLANISASKRFLSAGTYFNDHYYLSVATNAAYPDLTVDYDTTIESWWLHSYAVNQWAAINFSGTAELFGADAGAARVSKAFVAGITQDNGSNFTAYWKGPWQAFGAPFLRKRLRQVHVDGTGPFDLYVNKNFELGDTLAAQNLCATGSTTFGGSGNYGDNVFGDTSNTQEDRAYTLGVARAWSVGFRATTPTSMEIDSYTMAYTGRRN